MPDKDSWLKLALVLENATNEDNDTVLNTKRVSCAALSMLGWEYVYDGLPFAVCYLCSRKINILSSHKTLNKTRDITNELISLLPPTSKNLDNVLDSVRDFDVKEEHW